jgi:hypothetical protein
MKINIPGCHAGPSEASPIIAIDRDASRSFRMTKASERGWEYLFLKAPKVKV